MVPNSHESACLCCITHLEHIYTLTHSRVVQKPQVLLNCVLLNFYASSTRHLSIRVGRQLGWLVTLWYACVHTQARVHMHGWEGFTHDDRTSSDGRTCVPFRSHPTCQNCVTFRSYPLVGIARLCNYHPIQRCHNTTYW